MGIPEYISVEYLNQHYTNNIVGHLGIQFTDIGTEYLSGTMPVDQRTQQPLGILHGGASVVLAETLGSVAANCCVDPETHYCVGLDINANHVRGKSEGHVYGTARFLHLGKQTQIWQITITDENDKLVNVSRLTMAVLPKNS